MPLRVGSNESALSLQIGVSRHVFAIACPERVLAKSAVLHRHATVFRLKYARSHARISSISATGYDPSPTTDDAFACRTVSFPRHADDSDAQQTGWGCSSPSAKIPVLTQKNASLLIAIQHWAWQNQHVYSIWRKNGRAFAATITLHAMLREQLPMTDTQRRPVHLK